MQLTRYVKFYFIQEHDGFQEYFIFICSANHVHPELIACRKFVHSVKFMTFSPERLLWAADEKLFTLINPLL
jgi:hypothetical protein